MKKKCDHFHSESSWSASCLLGHLQRSWRFRWLMVFWSTPQYLHSVSFGFINSMYRAQRNKRVRKVPRIIIKMLNNILGVLWFQAEIEFFVFPDFENKNNIILLLNWGARSNRKQLEVLSVYRSISYTSNIRMYFYIVWGKNSDLGILLSVLSSKKI